MVICVVFICLRIKKDEDQGKENVTLKTMMNKRSTEMKYENKHSGCATVRSKFIFIRIKKDEGQGKERLNL